MKYKLKTILLSSENGTTQGIFLVEFDSRYDLAMTFLRYQEFYESPSPKFRNKCFTILDYMEWYSKQPDKNNSFTYPDDWAGFNIPDHIIYSLAHKIPDYNKYDACMDSIVDKIDRIMGRAGGYTGSKFYITGAQTGQNEVVLHEVAHALYYLSESYRKEIDKKYKALSDKHKRSIESFLKDNGYTKHVYKDEAQAYLSTGDRTGNKLVSLNVRKAFVEVFDRYAGNIIL